MTRDEHLYTILAEEGAEVAQRATKLLRFGPKDIEPGQEETNIARLEAEYNDVLAMGEMLGLKPRRELIDQKIGRVKTYLAYSEMCGTLDVEDGPQGPTR